MKRLLLPALLPVTVFSAPADIEHFEKEIRPVLVSECVDCHGAQKQKGGLRLDYRDGWKKGGDSGAAIVPGQPAKSLLLTSIRHEDPDMKMPQKRPKLSAPAIAAFEKWIADGAADPRDHPPKDNAGVPWESIAPERAKWWSLQPISPAKIPPVSASHSAWPSSDIDRLLLARMEAAGLQPAQDAEPSVLFRRLSFLLLGLPPAPADIASFQAEYRINPSSALAHAVDRMLASPAFGEHWARHWLDLVRYAESHGSESDPEIPEAWRYRDYVVRAINADVPWDSLIREHIAGDLLAVPRWNVEQKWNESSLGVAHLRLVEHGFQPIDTRDEQIKTVDSQIDVITKAFQATTVSCARCHDHKFDAVSQRDYTAIAGIFESSRPAMLTIDSPDNLHLQQLPSLKTAIRATTAAAWKAQAARIPEGLAPSPQRTAALAAATAALAQNQRQHDILTNAVRERLLKTRTPAAALAHSLPPPLRRWGFAEPPAGGQLVGDSTIHNGALRLKGNGYFRSAPLGVPLAEKTLEAWVRLADLDQRGGGVLTVETPDGAVFDSIVFAEKAPRTWMAGSDFFRRGGESGGPADTAIAHTHLAIVYRKNGEIAIYRDGHPFGKPWLPPANKLISFAQDAHILIGLRHLGAANGFLRGDVDEARVYATALTPEQIHTSYNAGPDSTAITPQELTAAMTPEERTKSAHLAKERDTHQATIAALQDPWAQALDAARRNPRSPLAPWWQPAPAPLAPATPYPPAALPHRHGPGVADVPAGTFTILPEGPRALSPLLPSGIATGLHTRKHGGIASTARFRITTDFISVHAAGAGAQCRLIVDGYPLGINPIFPRVALDADTPRWLLLDTKYRKGSWAYLEFSTALDTSRREKADPRSWFFVDSIVPHDGPGPKTQPPTFAHLFGPSTEPAHKAAAFSAAVHTAIDSWATGEPTPSHLALLNALLDERLLDPDPPAAAELIAQYRATEAAIPVPRRIPGVVEADSADAHFLPRGDHLKPGPQVPRGYLAALRPAGFPVPPTATGRLQLAQAITAPTNPLTARVMANRIWLHVFGRGIVATPDDFGRMGDAPSHPELLDFLATRLATHGWSLKNTLRELLATRAFRLASEPPPLAKERDPQNILLTHATVRRIPAESIRDTLLALGGKLNAEPFGPPERDGNRRSIYQSIRRNALNPFLTTFDAPKPFSTLGRRDATNVPGQSLALLNAPFVIASADAWGKRIAALPATSRVEAMILEAFGRTPTPEELAQCATFAGPDATQLGSLAHALINTKEFIYLR